MTTQIHKKKDVINILMYSLERGLNNMDKEKNKKPKKRKKIHIVFLGLFLLAVMCFITSIVFRNQIKTIIDSHYDNKPMAEEVEEFYNNDLVGEEGEVEETISETNIRKVFDISGLQTADYIYNSVVRVYDDKDDSKIKYYVSYEGTIKVGINFNDIKIEIDDDNKKIIFTIPEVEIQDTIVEAGTLDFIFEKEKYDTDETYNEAYQKCQNDLDQKAKSETDLLKTAQDNTEQVIKALTTPWIDQVYPDYKMEFQLEEVTE